MTATVWFWWLPAFTMYGSASAQYYGHNVHIAICIAFNVPLIRPRKSQQGYTMPPKLMYNYIYRRVPCKIDAYSV